MRQRQPIRLVRQTRRETDDYGTLCRLLAWHRASKGITQAALGSKLGRDQVFVGKVEGGTRRLDPVELLVILDALKIDPGEFFVELRREIRKPAKTKK